jgi:hypothetical protein
LKTTKSSDYYHQGKLRLLQQGLMCNIEDLLVKLEVPLQRNSRFYYGCCPIHGGDNPQAINLYLEGDYVPGFWRCNTRNCEAVFKKNVLGFVRGCLSAQKGWGADSPKEKVVAWDKTVDFAAAFLGVRLAELKVDEESEALANFTKTVGRIFKASPINGKLLKRADVVRHLQIPSPYFIHRGLSREVLCKFDVGDYAYAAKPLSNRAVVPIYDEDGRYVVGFTGRWIGDHETDGVCKWLNHGFAKEAVLYGWWSAKRAIEETRSVILVEGPGEVWKLCELGIENGVALLGKSLSDCQQIMLERSGAMNVTICLNNDLPGLQGGKKILSQLQRSFRTKTIVPIGNDLQSTEDDNWIYSNLK